MCIFSKYYLQYKILWRFINWVTNMCGYMPNISKNLWIERYK